MVFEGSREWVKGSASSFTFLHRPLALSSNNDVSEGFVDSLLFEFELVDDSPAVAAALALRLLSNERKALTLLLRLLGCLFISILQDCIIHESEYYII